METQRVPQASLAAVGAAKVAAGRAGKAAEAGVEPSLGEPEQLSPMNSWSLWRTSSRQPDI